MTDQELLDAAWEYKGGYLTLEVFVEALGTKGPGAFRDYMASTDKRLPGAVRSHWLPKLSKREEQKTLAA